MFAHRRMPAAPPSMRTMSVPAPIGGLNTLSGGMAMPPSDCFLLYNMIAAEYGLRVRLGYREWCAGLTGAGDDYVRSVMPFAGSSSSGANNKLFAITSSDVYDVTSSSASPSSVFTLPITSGRAGHGVCHTHVTSAGHFLLYWDEVNGMHVYGDAGATGGWADTFDAITEGVDPATQISGVDPASLVFGTVFKGRVWCIEKDTANLWYSAAGSIFGAYTKFTLGTKLRAGGSLRSISNWTYDGGAGIDDSLVAISDGGDVVVYQGTDPASASTFGINGVWYAGDLPVGREIATNMGGDMLIATRLGIIPMSKLVIGQSIMTSQYETAKISNLFNNAMLSKAGTYGWSMRLHPEDNALIVTVPEAEGEATTQLVMSMATKSWSRYRDLPIYSSGIFGGKLYFGDTDGSVWINDGYADGITLADPTSYTAIQYAGLSSFQNFGTGRQKQIQAIRPYFQSESTDPSFDVSARYDFDQSELATVSLSAGSGSTWDAGVWDTALWGGEYSPSFAVRGGGSGMGVNAALAWRGASISRTILTGFDLGITEGGFL